MGVTPECDTIGTIYISNATGIQELPDVCFGQGYYYIVYSDPRQEPETKIAVSRVTPQWVVVDTGNFVSSSSTYQITPAIAFDGERSLVVWRDLDNPIGIRCRFVDINGQAQGSVITLSTSINAANPKITFGELDYLIVWQDFTTNNNIIGQFVSPAGSLVGNTFEITSGPENHVTPSVSFQGSQYLVVWSQAQIWGQLVSTTGSLIGQSFPISNSQNPQVAPDIVFGHDEFLAVWSEMRTDFDIYGNVFVPTSICESITDVPMPEIYPAQTIITYGVEIIGAKGIQVMIFDACGRMVGQTHNGRWDARSVPTGIYFLNIENNRYWFKIVKIR